MPKWLSNILPYISIPVLIAVGTIVYKAGAKSEQTVDKNDLVLYRVNVLTDIVEDMKQTIDSTAYRQSKIISELSMLRREVLKDRRATEMKLDCIVSNLPNNDKLIRQLYDIERAIERKNDTIDLLTTRNEMLKKQYKIGVKKLEEDRW